MNLITKGLGGGDGFYSLLITKGLGHGDMANSIRQLIVDAIVTRMQSITTVNSYETELGANVYEWRTTDLQASELPCVIIKDASETVVVKGSVHEYTLPIELEIKATGSDMTVIRDALADVIVAVGTDPGWGSLVVRTIPVENETLDFDQQDRKYSTTILKLELTYRTKPFQPFDVL